MNDEPTTQADQVTLQDYRQMLHRRRKTVIRTFIAVVLLGITYTIVAKPVLRRVIRILVEGKGLASGPQSPTDPLNNIFTPPYAHEVDSQMEVLKSPAIQAAACEASGLNPAVVLDPQHPLIHIDVKQIMTTDVIEITIDGPSARQINKLADNLPVVYLNYVLQNRMTEITSALNFARGRKEEERRKLQAAEQALESFKMKNRLVNLDTERNNHIIAAINADVKLREAGQSVAVAQARLKAAIAARAALPATVRTDSSATNTQQIQAQKDRIAALRTEQASLSYYYKPDSPEMQRINRQISELEQQLAALPPTVTTVNRATNDSISAYDDKVAEARGALNGAEAELARTRTDAAALAAQLTKYSPIERQQAEIQREVDEHQNAFNLLATSVEALSLREKGSHVPVQNLSRPEPALQIAPRPLTYIAISMILGLILGCLLAIAQDKLDTRLYTAKSCLKIVGAPALAYVPQTPPGIPHLLTQQCDGPVLESYRMLRSNISFLTDDVPLSSLLITSTLPGEGKSVTALNLAGSMVYDDRQVILVDADIRHPSLHDKLGLRRAPGLTDVLLGEISLEEALQDTSIPGLSFLGAGQSPARPAELLDSKAMHELHAELKQHADVTVFDGPPCLVSVDTIVLSEQTDGLIYVIQPGKVKKEELDDSLNALWRANARLLGVVFSQVDPGDHHYFEYQEYYSLPFTMPSAEVARVRMRRPKRPKSRSEETSAGRTNETSGQALVPLDQDEKEINNG